MTEAPQLAPMVSISTAFSSMSRAPSTSLMISLALVETVSVVLTM